MNVVVFGPPHERVVRVWIGSIPSPKWIGFVHETIQHDRLGIGLHCVHLLCGWGDRSWKVVGGVEGTEEDENLRRIE